MKKFIKWIISRYTMQRQELMFYDQVNEKPVYKYIDKYNENYMAQSKIGFRVLLENIDEDIRECHTCGDKMYEGYCIEDGMEYYCSEECLYTKYTKEEYLDMYDNGNGSSYYTNWVK